MKTKDFDYELPEELIAQTPLEKRDESRLMCLDKETGAISHRHFYELPEFLKPGDCLILNNSRVLPARRLGQRLRTLAMIVLIPLGLAAIFLASYALTCILNGASPNEVLQHLAALGQRLGDVVTTIRAGWES